MPTARFALVRSLRLPLIAYRRATEGPEAYLRSRGLEPDIVFRSDEGGIVQGLVGAGIGYAVVPLLGVDDDSEISVLEVASIPPRQITLAWHADRAPTPAAQAFLEIVTGARSRDHRRLRSQRDAPIDSFDGRPIVRLLTVVGNRPQFIKSAPLSARSRRSRNRRDRRPYRPALGRRHVAVFYDELGLADPAVTLDLRTSDVATIEAALRSTVAEHSPDAVLVYGDTNSTLAGARAGRDRPVAHVEAGLRSGDLTMPEERNRIEVDRCLGAPVRARRAIGGDPPQRSA